ncbi:dienelactone hydrolase family protein [Brevundimonas sp. FT23042]|uniref:dienelactone hydrolase family protein n=1 Tax=Brevundimonas sp. FT23042 TaxID=3393749 RepID=UPI003B587047
MSRSRPVHLAMAGLLALAFPGAPGQPAAAAAGPQSAPQVGVPGCADDVPVRASRTLIHFDSRGRSVRAYLYAPAIPNGQGVVMLHGGTGFEMNSILFDAHAIQLASRGYVVILPAYFDAARPDRGRPVVTARAWRQAALDAAARLEEERVSPDRVTLWGYSRGAGVGLAAVTASDSPVRSAVLVAGGGSVDDPVAPDVQVLLLHARRDEAVPVRATRRLAEDLREAGASVGIEELAYDGHQYDLPTWCAVFSRTRVFITARSGQ